jgi:hypothetical protein
MQSGRKATSRYATLAFDDAAKLDDGRCVATMVRRRAER